MIQNEFLEYSSKYYSVNTIQWIDTFFNSFDEQQWLTNQW